jgi:hypothetical protein
MQEQLPFWGHLLDQARPSGQRWQQAGRSEKARGSPQGLNIGERDARHGMTSIKS